MKEVNGFRISRDDLTLSVGHGPLAAVLSYKQDKIVFGPLVGRAHLITETGRFHDPNTSLVGGWQVTEEEISTPAGEAPGLRAVLTGVPGLPLTVTWQWALIGGGDALVRMEVANQADRPMNIGKIVPLAYRGADPGLDMGAAYTAWRVYRTGYQSWSPAGSIAATGEDHKPRFFLPSRAGTNPRTPYSRKQGDKVSDWMMQLYETEMGLATLAGFITGASFAGRVEYEVKYDRFRRLEAVSDCEEREMGARESVASEWAIVSFSEDPHKQQARYYDLWGKAMEARQAPAKTGWCSWYWSFTGITERAMQSNLERASRLDVPVEVFQLDDGYEKAVGDWTDWNEKFPSPPAQLATKIREAGMEPGLWLAPFLVSRASDLYKKHPDWILRTKRGTPVVAFFHPQWKGLFIHALDTSHPQVLSWLEDTFRKVVRDFGFSYLKLDFLYAASLPGERYDKKATGTSALRKGLETVRKAAGDDAYILGCGCPLGPAVGVVDAMRISPDIDAGWTNKYTDLLTGVPIGPGAKNCLRNNLARLPMQGRLWQNDPDCLVLRGGLTRDEVQSEITVAYASGGLAFLSEDLASLAPEMVEWFQKLLPPSQAPFMALDLLKKGFPEKAVLKNENSVLAAVFNFQTDPRDLRLSLTELGLSGFWHAFDFWEKRYLGAFAESIDLGKVGPHGVRYLRLVRSAESPRLLGTDLHMGMGETGFRVNTDQNGIDVRASLPGKREGTIWAVFPGGAIEAVHVVMEDGWEGRIEKA